MIFALFTPRTLRRSLNIHEYAARTSFLWVTAVLTPTLFQRFNFVSLPGGPSAILPGRPRLGAPRSRPRSLCTEIDYAR